MLCFRLVEDISFRCLHAGPLIGFVASDVGKDLTFEGFQNAIGGGRYSEKGNASLEEEAEHLWGINLLLLRLCWVYRQDSGSDDGRTFEPNSKSNGKVKQHKGRTRKPGFLWSEMKVKHDVERTEKDLPKKKSEREGQKGSDEVVG